jgi:outer membrane protein assembly factor BamD
VTVATPSDAWQEASQKLERGKTHDAATLCEAVDFRFAADERAEMEPLIKLCIADATFYKGTALDLISARQLYLDFVTLFGDHPLAPYAQFQAGACALEQANHPSKDQSQTQSAFADLAVVEQRYPGSAYSRAASDMIDQAKARLAEHEFIVGRFYYKRKAWLAAAQRFKVIVEAFPEYPEMAKVYYHLGQALLRNDTENVEGLAWLDKVIADYPNGEYTKLARKARESYGDPLELTLDGVPAE